jgi:hypothetical protein
MRSLAWPLMESAVLVIKVFDKVVSFVVCVAAARRRLQICALIICSELHRFEEPCRWEVC